MLCLWPTARRAIVNTDGIRMVLGDLVDEKMALGEKVEEKVVVVEVAPAGLKNVNEEAAGTVRGKVVAAVAEERALVYLLLQRDRQVEIAVLLYKISLRLQDHANAENRTIRRREVPILQADQSVTLARA